MKKSRSFMLLILVAILFAFAPSTFKIVNAVNVGITITSSTTGSGYVSVDGSGITTPHTYTWLIGATHLLTASSSVAVVADQSQNIYKSWSDGGAQSHNYTVPGANATVTANFQLQYNVTISASVIGSDTSGVVATLGGVTRTKAQLPYSKWFNNSASCTYSFTDPIVPTNIHKQYIWDTTSGLGTDVSGSFTVSTYGSLTATYIPEWQITITSSGIGTDSTGVVVMFHGSNYTQSDLPWTEWIDDGSSLTYNFTSPVTVSITKEYVWQSTSGLGQTLQHHAFTVTGNGTITGTYVAEPLGSAFIVTSVFNNLYAALGLMVILPIVIIAVAFLAMLKSGMNTDPDAVKALIVILIVCSIVIIVGVVIIVGIQTGLPSLFM